MYEIVHNDSIDPSEAQNSGVEENSEPGWVGSLLWVADGGEEAHRQA